MSDGDMIEYFLLTMDDKNWQQYERAMAEAAMFTVGEDGELEIHDEFLRAKDREMRERFSRGGQQS
jgi:hypothetical protein